MKIKINLVPPVRKEEIEKASRLRAVFRWELEILAIFVFAVIIIASTDAIVKMNLSAAVSEFERIDKNSQQYKTIDDYDNDIVSVHFTYIYEIIFTTRSAVSATLVCIRKVPTTPQSCLPLRGSQALGS